MAKQRACSWKCGRTTNRICGICLNCCNERDERNRRIDAGLEAYVPPQDRPGHRFYERKNKERVVTDAQKAALATARAAKSLKQMPQAGVLP